MFSLRVVVGLFAICTIAQAETLKWPETPYSYYSQQEPLRDTLAALAASQGIPIIISDQVTAIANANYHSMPPGEIFTQLVGAYNLTWYFDGKVLHVYTLDEIDSATIRLNCISLATFEQELKNLGVYDERFYWRGVASRGLLYVNGPERYLDLIKSWVVALDDCGGQSDTPAVTSCWISGVMTYTDDPARCDSGEPLDGNESFSDRQGTGNPGVILRGYQ
ncbi:MAG: hypothetical protein ACFCBW_14065 [Candidatus Competibacterales bacterium]